jgi:RHS repeat-associated protein
MHEHLDEMGVIHMNGRIYDPLIGRFMSADPFIQAPENLQSHNRFAYVMNNPLSYTDPSGYFSLKKLFRAVLAIAVGYFTGQWIGNAFQSAAVGANATTAFASIAPAASAGSALTSLGSAIAGMGGGFAAGLVGSGSLKGAINGAFSGGVFGAIGGLGAEGSWSTGQYVAAHAAGGCITSVAGGGQCGPGALSAAFGKFTTLKTQDWGPGVAQFTASVVAGGVGSVIGGGKFENGAITAAYAYLFNNCVANPAGCLNAGARLIQAAYGRLQMLAASPAGQIATQIAAAEVGLSSAGVGNAANGAGKLAEALSLAKPDPKHPGQFVAILDDGARMMFRKEYGHVAGYGATEHFNVHLQQGSKAVFNVHVVTDSLGIKYAVDSAKVWNNGVPYTRPIAQQIPHGLSGQH